MADSSAKELSECTIIVVAPPKKSELRVLYTKSTKEMERCIHFFERRLDERVNPVVGFDLEYTPLVEGVQKVALAQFYVYDRVVLYHYCHADQHCTRFVEFLGNIRYSFAMVDASNDRKVLRATGLACPSLVDIQDHYKIIENTHNSKDSLADLAKDIINPISYDNVNRKITRHEAGEFHAQWMHGQLTD